MTKLKITAKGQVTLKPPTMPVAPTRWRCPESVVILPVVDLHLPLTLAVVWRRDNASPLLAKFIADVRLLPDVRALNKD